MLDWFKAAPVTWCIVLGVFLIAGVGVIVAVVTKGRWKDRGFLVRDGLLLKWNKSKFPLKLYAEAGLPQLYYSALASIVTRINTAVGVMLFTKPEQLTKEQHPTDIQVMVAQALPEELGSELEATKHQFNKVTGEILSAYVLIKADQGVDVIDKIILHALGHTLGLDHDESTGSIMHPLIQSRFQRLTERDIKLLSSTYR